MKPRLVRGFFLLVRPAGRSQPNSSEVFARRSSARDRYSPVTRCLGSPKGQGD
jgi:hypothetical protein